ncbi:hypothetical protein M8J75_003845 [Diaphorina citri]|nr:hypothetical protein M8J75_003845 [Diaphorina citri]
MLEIFASRPLNASCMAENNAWINEQDLKIQEIQRTLLEPIEPLSELVIKRRNIFQTLDLILGLTPE